MPQAACRQRVVGSKAWDYQAHPALAAMAVATALTNVTQPRTIDTFTYLDTLTYPVVFTTTLEGFDRLQPVAIQAVGGPHITGCAAVLHVCMRASIHGMRTKLCTGCHWGQGL